MSDPITAKEFRAELVKLMPGYNWTIHKQIQREGICATGIQASGFNRLSTLEVDCVTSDAGRWYTVRSAGHGTKSPWSGINSDATLARALRGLQAEYQRLANKYQSLIARLQDGRKQPGPRA